MSELVFSFTLYDADGNVVVVTDDRFVILQHLMNCFPLPSSYCIDANFSMSANDFVKVVFSDEISVEHSD